MSNKKSVDFTRQHSAAEYNANYEVADQSSLLFGYGLLNVHNLIQLDLGVFMYKTQKG